MELCGGRRGDDLDRLLDDDDDAEGSWGSGRLALVGGDSRFGWMAEIDGDGDGMWGCAKEWMVLVLEEESGGVSAEWVRVWRGAMAIDGGWR